MNASSGNLALGVAAGTVASYAVAAWMRQPAAVPVLNALPAFPVMLYWLRRERTAAAVAAMLVWAAAMAASATVLAVRRPDLTGTLFLRGEAYRREMFAWVRTGAGREGDPARFVPQHAVQAAVFCGAAAASGGVLAMPLGALLTNEMGHYAGSLGFASDRPWLVAALAWPPWALLRVASFVVLGVVLSGPLLARVVGFSFALRRHGRWLGVAVLGLAADAGLKWWLAETWSRWLRQLVGW